MLLLAMLLDAAIIGTRGFEQVARERVKVMLSVKHEVIQVFVNCRLDSYFSGIPQLAASRDLGWLDHGDIVTFQVRGRKHVGYYEISLAHGSHTKLVVRAARFGQPRRFPSGRPIFERSFMADGRELGDQGCQPDSPHRLAFAAPNERTAGRWQGRSSLMLDGADAMSPIVPWAFALIGAAGLIFASVRARMQRADTRRMDVAGMLGGFVDIALGVIVAEANQHFGLAFVLCVVAGIASLLVLFARLVIDEARALRLKRSAGGGGRPRIEGGEGATTADGI